jgi:hypothetical protein
VTYAEKHIVQERANRDITQYILDEQLVTFVPVKENSVYYWFCGKELHPIAIDLISFRSYLLIFFLLFV